MVSHYYLPHSHFTQKEASNTMKTRKNLRWEEMDKGKMELGQIMQHFEAFNSSEGKSPRTVEWYNEVLTLFLRWLQSERKPTQLGAIGEAEVRALVLVLFLCRECGSLSYKGVPLKYVSTYD